MMIAKQVPGVARVRRLTHNQHGLTPANYDEEAYGLDIVDGDELSRDDDGNSDTFDGYDVSYLGSEEM